MPLQTHDRIATLTGVLTVDEVEPLVAWFRDTDQASVDLTDCTHLHTGALQALLRFRPAVLAGPRDTFLADHVLPWLKSEADEPIHGGEVNE